MNKNIYYLIVLIFLMSGACQPTQDREAVHQLIADQNEKLHEVVRSKNILLLDEVYAADAYFMAPGQHPVKGRKAIKDMWQSSLNRMTGMHSTTLEIFGEGDIVSEVGIVETYIRLNDSTSFTYHAKYNNVWQKDEEGVYRLKVDIWNDLPGD